MPVGHGTGDAPAHSGLVTAPRLCRWETEAGAAASHWPVLLWEPPAPELRRSSADVPLGRAPVPVLCSPFRSKALFSESFSLLLSHYPGKMVTLAVQSVFTMETSWKGGHAAPRSSQVRLCIPSLRRWLWSSFLLPGMAGLCQGPWGQEPGCPVPTPCGAGQCPGAEGAAGAHQGSRTFPSPQCPSGAGLKDTKEPVVEPWSRAAWPGHRDRDAPWSMCWSHVCATSIPEGLSTGLVTQAGTRALVGGCARLMVSTGHLSQPGTVGSPVTPAPLAAPRPSGCSHHNGAGCLGRLWAE